MGSKKDKKEKKSKKSRKEKLTEHDDVAESSVELVDNSSPDDVVLIDADREEMERKRRKKAKKEKKAEKARHSATLAVSKESSNSENDNDVPKTAPKSQDDEKDSSVTNLPDMKVEGEEEGTKKRRKRKRKRKKESEDTLTEAETVDVPATDGKKSMEVDRTVYVEGIPFAASPDDVQGFFVDNDCADITDCRLPVWQDSGRLRGYGHIVFETIESHGKALALTGKYLKNRYLTIQPANKPKDIQQQTPANSEPSKTIAVHNLSYNALEDDVEKVFASFGSIRKGGVRVVRNTVTGQSKGFCYVEFTELESAKDAMDKATQIEILGRPCRIDYDHGRVKGSFRTADHKLWQKEYGGKD